MSSFVESLDTKEDFSVILTILTFLGLHNGRGKNYLYAANTVHIAYILAMIVIEGIFEKSIFHDGAGTTKFLDIIQPNMQLANHLLISVETIFCHKMDDEIWKIISEIDHLTSNIWIEKSNRKLIHRIFVMFSVLLLSCVTSECVTIASTYYENSKWTKTLLIRFVSFQICRINLIHFLLYVAIIRDRLEKLKLEFQYLSQFRRNWRNGKFTRNYFLKIRMLHNKIKFLHLKIEERFRSTIFMVANYFICLTICFYFIVTRIYFARYDAFLGAFLHLFPFVYGLIILSWTCDSCAQESKDLGSTLHTTFFTADESAHVRRLSIQILANDLLITAANFFVIDLRLLKNVCYAIITYMVIFVTMNRGEGRF